jgi:hypothetical protein
MCAQNTSVSLSSSMIAAAVCTMLARSAVSGLGAQQNLSLVNYALMGTIVKST